MITQKYIDMLGVKSVIRKMSEYAVQRGQEIGYDNVFDYTLGNPSVPVPAAFTEAMTDLLTNPASGRVHGYSQSLGIPSVRKTIAESLSKRFGIGYEAEHIFMTTGAAGAVAHAVRCVTQPGDEVITFAPFFPEYLPYINESGAKLRIVPPDTDQFQIPFEQFEEMMNEKVMAILINSPNNPSGAVYSEETIARLSQLLRTKEKEYGHDIFVISDEPYREIVFAGVKIPNVARYYDNVLTCYSYSKSLSIPGERIGYLAASPNCTSSKMIALMCGQISRGIGHNCPPSIIQLAVARVIDETADLSVYETNANLIYEELISLGFTCRKPEGTFYIFPKALEEDAKVFCEKALAYELALVPGDSFGCPGFFRMAYCIETEKVERSLVALRRFVESEYPAIDKQ